MSRHAVVAGSVGASPGGGSDAVVMENGHIVALTRRERLADTPAVEYPGATILPTFSDSHLHPLGYAALVSGTSLKEATTPADLWNLLSEAASRLGPGEALMAQRLSEGPLGRLPTRHDLDLAVPDRPAIAYRYCGHIAVVNTAALRLARITEATPDPPGGSLDRDAAGAPTGVLRETAVDLIGSSLEPLLPPPSTEKVMQAMEGLAALGLGHIGAMVASGHPLWCGVGNELEQLCDIASDLPLDMDVMVIADTPTDLERAAARIGETGGRLRFWGWKYFADGSLGGHTAAMWDPFCDRDTTGTLRLDHGPAEDMARVSLALGGVVAVHAIGDRAIDESLALFERLIGHGIDPNRLRMEHVSVPSDSAIRRLAETGTIASVQPSFLTSEPGWVPERLGRNRPPYRFRTMHAAGVRMIGGSDCPVETPDPLVGIAAATMREGWEDGEHLPLTEAIDLFTTAPADHFSLPRPLTPGSPADFLIVEGTPGTTDAAVVAIYRAGEKRSYRPVPWPG